MQLAQASPSVTDTNPATNPSAVTPSRTFSSRQLPDQKGQADDEIDKQKENVLQVFQNGRNKKDKELDEAQKKALKNLSCTRDANGMLTVFGNDSNAPLMRVDQTTKSVTTYYNENEPDDSKGHIDAILQSAAALRAMGENPPVTIKGHDDLSTLMMAKADSLAGLSVANKPDKTLDQVNPALARKMEDEWAKMQAQNQPNPDSPQARKSAASDVMGLTQPSIIATDKTPPLSPIFAAKADPAPIAATTPVPGVSPPQMRPGAPT